jgi:hypothetical protein
VTANRENHVRLLKNHPAMPLSFKNIFTFLKELLFPVWFVIGTQKFYLNSKGML